MQAQTVTPMQKKVDVIPANILLTKPNARKRKLRVAAYCRVSTEQEEQQSSYAAQIAYYTEKINKNKDWELAINDKLKMHESDHIKMYKKRL